MCLGCIVTFADHTRSVQITFYFEQEDGCTLNPVVEFSGKKTTKIQGIDNLCKRQDHTPHLCFELGDTPAQRLAKRLRFRLKLDGPR